MTFFNMFDKNDLQVLREMKDEILAKTSQMIEKSKGDILATVHKDIYAVRADVIEVINDGILPQVEYLNVRVTRLERLQRQNSY